MFTYITTVRLIFCHKQIFCDYRNIYIQKRHLLTCTSQFRVHVCPSVRWYILWGIGAVMARFSSWQNSSEIYSRIINYKIHQVKIHWCNNCCTKMYRITLSVRWFQHENNALTVLFTCTLCIVSSTGQESSANQTHPQSCHPTTAINKVLLIIIKLWWWLYLFTTLCRKNALPLASCSLEKRRLILIILGK